MKFSEKLIKLRKENKLSQEELASKLDVSRQSVSKWESGQTYPEMDKLLSLCKIFKCSLDDLTNDEISKDEMTNSQTKKNSFINLIYEMLEFINKSISMLKSMSLKKIIKMVFLLFLLCIFLLFLYIPFTLVIDAGWSILWSINVNENFTYMVGNGLEFIIKTIYLILSAIIFIYIYKVRYLDKFEEKEEVIVKYINDKKEEVEDKKDKKEVKIEERIVVKREKNSSRSFALFNVLGTIMKYFLKFIVICIAIPFVFSLLIIAFFLIIDIIFTFKGVIFIGVLLGLIFALLFNIMLVEVILKFIFNIHINFKKIFIMFFVSVIGIGISLGIFALEATTIKFYDEIPKEIEKEKIEKDFKINKDSYIFYDNYSIDCDNEGCNYHVWEWKYDIEKKYDEQLKDKVKIEFIYNKDYTELEIIEENEKININKYDINDYNTLINLLNVAIDKLKDKEIYNYDSYYYQQVKVIVTTSKANHELLEENAKAKTKKLEEDALQNRNNQYEQEINNLEEEIDNLNDQISSLQNSYDDLKEEKQNEIEELNEKLEEKEQELQEYKEKISNLLDE